jgi:hypothetical protein
LTYDNYDFIDTIKDQTLGSTQQMVHFATAYGIVNPSIPTQGLTQNMIRRSKPLREEVIGESLIAVKDNLNEALWIRQLIFRALDHGIGQAFGDWRKIHDIPWPKPSTNVLPCDAQNVIYLGGLAINTGTTEGTADVHRVMLEQELGIQIEDNDSLFEKRLYLINGDQKSVELSRACRNEQTSSDCSFERRDWMLPIPALFHVQMNLASALLQAFWQPADKEGPGIHTPHSFLADISFLGIKGISLERAPWYDLDMLIRTSFDARILAAFLQYAEELDFATKQTHKTPEGMSELLQKMSPDDVEKVLDLIDVRIFSPTADRDKDGIVCPPHMKTLARFMQMMYWYLVLRHAIRYGDIETVTLMFPVLALIFLGTGKTKYAREMLYLIWLLSSEVSDPELQEAIRSSMLANISGRQDSFLPVDRLLEHVNAMIRIDQKNRKNSTHDSHTTFDKWLRVVPILADIRKTVQGALNINSSLKHSVKSTSTGVIGIAYRLWEDGWTDPHKKLDYDDQATSDDLIALGQKQFYKAMDSFNLSVVDHARRPLVARTPFGDRAEGEVDESNTLDNPTINENNIEIERPMLAEGSIGDIYAL